MTKKTKGIKTMTTKINMNNNERIVINLPNGSVLNISNVTLGKAKSMECSVDRISLDHFDCDPSNQLKLDSFGWQTSDENTWTNCTSQFAEDNELGGRNITTLNHNTINKG